jgi:hypothetical protein
MWVILHYEHFLNELLLKYQVFEVASVLQFLFRLLDIRYSLLG